MKGIMTPLGTTILIAALINFVFSGSVYLHSRKKLVETIFVIFALNVSLWSLATFLATSQAVPFPLSKLGAFTHYVSGNLVFLFLFLFAAYYPSQVKISKIWPIIIIFMNTLILTQVIFASSLFVSLQEASAVVDKIRINPTGYFTFSIMTILMFILSQIYLAKKHKFAVATDKTHLGFLVLGTSIAGSLGLISNLIFPGFDNFSFFYLGPIITTPLFVGVLIFAILKYKLLNLRIIAAEMFTALLIIATAINLFSAGTKGGAIVQGAILLVVLAFGYLLIRSVYREVYAREKMETLSKELAAVNEELKKLDADKSEFISLAGHQLRAPLTAIKGYVSMILEGAFGALSERVGGILRTVFSATENLVKLTAELLDLSRIEAGHFQYEFAKIHLESVIEEVVKEVSENARKKNLIIEFKNETKDDAKTLADKDKMHEVIINFLDNAIKYSDAGTISVRLKMSSQKPPKLLLSIADNGMGIAKEDISKLFTKFKRTDEARKILPEGMGLGLYFVKRIIEDHGGKTWAESAGLGKGSTFFVELPTANS